MKKLRRMIVLSTVLLLVACDPAYIIRMDVVSLDAVNNSVPEMISDIAERNSMEPSKDTNDSKNRMNYWRGWGFVEDGHPNSISLSVEQVSASDKWIVEIFEWLVFSQSEFGEGLQIDVTETLKLNGYDVIVE